MDYTQRGVLDMQARIIKLVQRLAAEKRLLLDPQGVGFFDGAMALPAPGVPWKVTLRSHGKAESVSLPTVELVEFEAGRGSAVPHEIGAALDRLAA